MDTDNESGATALVPLVEKQVEFYGDLINAALVEIDGQQEVFVPIRPLCEYLGLSWRGQSERITRNPVLKEVVKGVRVTRTPSKDGISGGGPQVAYCLPLEFLPGWLFGVDSSRVKSELQLKIVRYQRECFRILWQAFHTEALAVSGNAGSITKKSEAISELERIRDMGLAMVRLAEQQIEMHHKLEEHDNRLDGLQNRLNNAATFMGTLNKEVANLREQLSPASLITETQAAKISDRVKQLAEYLNSLDPKKHPPYGAIFAELYRRFGVSDYHHIKRGQFDEVMAFLNDWRSSAGAGRLPNQLYMFREES